MYTGSIWARVRAGWFIFLPSNYCWCWPVWGQSWLSSFQSQEDIDMAIEWYHGAIAMAVLEAPDLHGMTPNIYQTYPRCLRLCILCEWTGAGGYSSCHQTSLVSLFWELAEILLLLGWTWVKKYDAMVQRLRLQTYMEWIPHPLQAYQRCLRPFIGCGWAGEYIIKKP